MKMKGNDVPRNWLVICNQEDSFTHSTTYRLIFDFLIPAGKDFF